MGIWAISDLHLPGASPRRRQRLEVDYGWGNYIDRMARTWNVMVQQNDLVLSCTLRTFKLLRVCYRLISHNVLTVHVFRCRRH
ncbi:MAG TPA: hypothetical protein VMW83_16585 [Spirochaetia bacterium]|nr:hypothetical protein [Spirochaetia bacterium]